MTKAFSREKWRHLRYTVSHPSDGFYWIRHGEKGSVGIALLMVLIFSLCFSLNRAYAGFVVNDVNPRSVNGLTEMIGVALLFLILCAGNWSVTCLMNGEGRFKDIVIAVGYSLVPLNICLILSTVLSWAVAENEAAFYSIVIAVGIAYTAVLMLIGIMQVHNYTLGKTLGTLLLTVIAMFIVIFLSMLVVDLIGKVFTFFRSIYTEMIFRM